MYRRSLLFVLVPVLLTAWSSQAETVQAKERQARVACLKGDYATGIEILSELFVTTKNPAFIFDQGRCFQQNRRQEEAIARFEEYLRVDKKLRQSDREMTEKHIAECQKAIDKRSSAAGAGAVSPGASKESKERAAKKACLTGDADAGVAILTDLYLDSNDTTHLFNQGRCFEQNRRYEDAITRFREYLVKTKNLKDKDKAEAEQHIATCESYIHKKAAETSAPEAQATSLTGGAPPPTSASPVSLTGPTPEVAATSTGGNSQPAETQATRGSAHEKQVGAFVEFERVLLAGISYGVWRGLEFGAGAVVGYYKGPWAGARYLFLEGSIKPGLMAAMPVFFVDGKAHPGIQGAATLQWDPSRHLGIYANVGLTYMPGAESDLGKLWFVPGIGVQGRL
jgi:hypothetical protein